MKASNHPYFRCILVLITLSMAGTASAVEKCAPDIATAYRSSIDAACPCDAFDGSDGLAKSDFRRCVVDQIRPAVESKEIRPACKVALKRLYAESVCGRGDTQLAPCVTTSPSGNVHCRISTAEQCVKRDGNVCSGLATCIDAADSTGDFYIDENDSGMCVSAVP